MSYDGPAENAVVKKAAWRLIPFLFFLYVIAYLDRVNVGFAKLHMNELPWFSDTIYGAGAGIFFLGYFLFEVPSNLILQKVGARIWIARIMFTWGAISMAMALVGGVPSFYGLRFLLGIAEAGFFPGVLLYLTFWFTQKERARVVAMFMTANAIAFIFGGPISGWILSATQGWQGLPGWKWLFLIEGFPGDSPGIRGARVPPERPARRPLALGSGGKRRSSTGSATEQVWNRAHGDLGTVLKDSRLWHCAGLFFSHGRRNVWHQPVAPAAHQEHERRKRSPGRAAHRDSLHDLRNRDGAQRDPLRQDRRATPAHRGSGHNRRVRDGVRRAADDPRVGVARADLGGGERNVVDPGALLVDSPGVSGTKRRGGGNRGDQLGGESGGFRRAVPRGSGEGQNRRIRVAARASRPVLLSGKPCRDLASGGASSAASGIIGTMNHRNWLASALAALALGSVSGCFRGGNDASPAPPPGPPAGMPALPPDPRGGKPATGGSSELAALPEKPVPGSALNKFFPKGVTFKQEKPGFSLADIKGGTLSITDLAGNPPGRDKFSSSSEKLEGYPAARVGNQGVAILVGGRYQVQVRSVSHGQGILVGQGRSRRTRRTQVACPRPPVMGETRTKIYGID